MFLAAIYLPKVFTVFVNPTDWARPSDRKASDRRTDAFGLSVKETPVNRGIVQIQPRKSVLDHADYTALTGQHELHHTRYRRTGMNVSALKYKIRTSYE